MNNATVMELALTVLGSPPLYTNPMTDGQQSQVWEVTFADRRVMVRLHADPRHFASTQYNLKVLAEMGMPVPSVLAADLTLTRFPLAYLILTKVPGRDLRHELGAMTELQMTRLAEQIVSFQKKVVALPPGTGYGYVGIGECGPYASWWEVALGQSACDLTLDRHGDAGGLRPRVRRLIYGYEPYLRSVPPTCFLDDITVKNVLVQGGALQGLVDFDCVCYGDPLYWLGLTAVGVVSDVGVRELFYVRELCRCLGLGDRQRRVVHLYAAWIALGFLDRFADGQTREWSARMLWSVKGWVTDLEGGAKSSTPSPEIVSIPGTRSAS